jgi:hypothetical protein
MAVILCLTVVQLAFIFDYVTHDPDLDPIPVRSYGLLRRLYITGPTQTDNSLLTLFTTAGDLPTTLKIHAIILNNWSNLISLGVQPVLYSPFQNATLLNEAQNLGWDILPLNRTNIFGLPYISDMFKATYHSYASDFYCYANADVLFDESLVQTLRFLRRRIREQKQRIFGVGKRSDVPVDAANPPPFHDLKFVRQLTKERSKDVHNIEYFITARYGFPWDRLSGGVVGRAGIGAHAMALALKSDALIIDCSDTIRAAHLKGVYDGPTARTLKDNLFNHFTLGAWDFTEGRIDRAGYFTAENNGTMHLYQKDTASL